MKLLEAIKEVIKSDVAWFTKENAVKTAYFLGCAFVTSWWWIPLSLLSAPMPLSLIMLVTCIGSIWSLFWIRVFTKWWNRKWN